MDKLSEARLEKRSVVRFWRADGYWSPCSTRQQVYISLFFRLWTPPFSLSILPFPSLSTYPLGSSVINLFQCWIWERLPSLSVGVLGKKWKAGLISPHHLWKYCYFWSCVWNEYFLLLFASWVQMGEFCFGEICFIYFSITGKIKWMAGVFILFLCPFGWATESHITPRLILVQRCFASAFRLLQNFPFKKNIKITPIPNLYLFNLVGKISSIFLFFVPEINSKTYPCEILLQF